MNISQIENEQARCLALKREGKNQGEIAAALGLTRHQVRCRINGALKAPIRSKVSPATAPALPGSQMEGGRKDDAGKPRMDLIPPEVMFALATVLGFGAVKYADRNWEKGMSWGRVFGALMRHLWAWWGGQGPTTKSFAFGDLDAETGFSHLWHALCCIAFLVAYEERGAGEDDRLKI